MLRRSTSYAFFILLSVVSIAASQDYRAEPLAEGPPADALSEELAGRIASKGVRVLRRDRAFCDIWLCKELELKADFKATPEILYPLEPGQLIGAIRFARRGSDFRDQRINRGVYTLRYAQQPVDGAHIGTSLTRDFLLLISAEHDASTKPLDYEKLTEESAEAAGSGHPCMLSLQRLRDGQGQASLRHDTRNDWWIVRIETESTKNQGFPMELVVIGAAAE